MRGSPFFDGVAQSEATIAGQSARLPIFYYDGSAIQAVFAARLGALRKLMPDPRFCPARLAPGLGAVAVTCFEYRDTDIGPYNELAIAVLLNEPYFIPNLPGLAMASSMRRRQLHAWVQHLPVTTEIARAGGVDFYNYPKFIAGIDFSDEGSRRVCRLSEGAEHILTLSGERIPTPRSEEFQLFSHLWMDRQPQSSEFKINALETGMSLRSGGASLELGDRHPIARELAGLIAFNRPLQYQRMARFEGILYGPEHLSPRLMPSSLLADIAAGVGAAQPA
jgi:Acetoacetate decarboxylase (ADC)